LCRLLFSESTNSEAPQDTGSPVSTTLEVETDSGYRQSTRSFILVGQTSRRLRLEPNSTSSIQLNALISLPGVYNLNQFCVYAAVQCNDSSNLDFDVNTMTLQKLSPPSFMEVEDSSYVHVSSSEEPSSLEDLDNS